jgi:hypothetical protein
MMKSLLAIALLVASAAPALAMWEQAQSRPGQKHVVSNFERKWGRMAHSRADRRQVGDPYSTPCDHSRSYSDNSCE